MAESFFAKNKTLVIAGGGGAALALLYLATRGSGGITVSGEAAVTSQLQSFWDAIQDALQAQSEALTESTAEAVAAASEELRAERAGLLDTLSNTLNASIGALTNQLNALFGRVSTLESETASLAEEVQSKSAELQTALQSQSSAFASQISSLQSQLSGVVKQPQAELMAEDTRYQAALAAVIGRFASDIAYWADSGRRANVINQTTNLFGLTGQKATAFKSHAESVYNQLRRGELGSAGSFLGPVESGPMGSAIVDRPGALSFGRTYAPDVALPVFGVKVSQ
jgi:uncharacterized protein YoxC